mmetsp:Transcript_115744/g.275087  ORF Transcript_115744/g.275087 Transcript_115744/m.275087 type:complete len:1372 (+) Transcript_115744:34-4149(+)
MGSEYLVNVSVFAVAGLKAPGDGAGMPNPFVTVEALDQKRSTQVISGASACTFNNFYSFSKHTSEDDFTGGDAVVVVYHKKNSFGFADKLGQVTFSLEKVYHQDGHLVPKDWFVIVLPDDPGKGCGYVELSLGAYAPGDIVPQSLSGGADEDEAAEVQSIKTRVVKLPTKDAAKSLFQLTVQVFQAEQLPMHKGVLSTSCSPYVQVDFNGTSQRTQTQKNNNPIWNEEVQVPFSMPAWDNSVNVVVMHDGGLTGSKIELGEVTLDIDDLANGSLEPTWFYFYKAPDGKKDEEKSEFAGRLLLAAQMERTEKPILTVNPGSMANPPKVTAGVAWIDLYMVCFDSTDQPEELYVQFELPRIMESEQPLVSAPPDPEGHGFVWKKDAIRLETGANFSLPSPENCGEFIISVFAKWKKKGIKLGGGKYERHMYARVPASEVSEWEQQPQWRDMRMVINGGADVGSAGFLLSTICLGPAEAAPKREKKMAIKWKDYCFRAKIYQAVNLPAKDEEGSSDPLVALSFGPVVMRTQIITQCINPSWNQILEENVTLPDDVSLRPDILITLLDSDEGSFEPMVQMRYKTSEEGALPTEWKKSPRWFQLEPVPGGVATQGKLLAAFELVPNRQAGEPRGMDSKTRKCRIDFFAIGARLRHDSGIDAENPILEVAWGRKEDNRAMPRRCKHTDAATRVVNNRFNWLKPISLKAKLMEDDMFQEYLELKLLTEVPGEKGKTEYKPVAHAAVHLSPHIPWVDPDRRAKLAQQFSFKHQDEDKGEQVDCDLEEDLNPKSGWDRLNAKVTQLKGGGGQSDQLICKQIGWDVDSIEESNARKLGFKEYAVVNDETEADNAAFIKDQIAQLEGADESEWNSTLLHFNRSFTWPQRNNANEGIDRHADYAAQLEEHLEPEKTDYSSTTLFLGSEWGEPRNLGKLKFCVRVVELDKDDKPVPSAHEDMSQKEWEDHIKKIQRRFEKSKDLVVRAYVLSGDGLRPPSGSSDCNSYVWSRVDGGGAEQNPVYNLKDNLTVRKHTLHPQFNKCHAFSSVKFPDHCMMTLSLVEVVPASFGSAAKEQVIGSTEIDLEDRWFNSHYQDMVQEDEVPIESRHLQTAGSIFSKGHIRLWLDIMYNQTQGAECPPPSAFAQERPIECLPSTDPLPFELRLAVFKVVDILSPEGISEPSVKASGKITLDDGTELYEETDTHFGCDDGTATLNWRLKFSVMIPCKQPRLTVQIWNDNMLASDEVLSEVTLDFSKDFLIARKHNHSIDFPKGSLYMYHPAFPGEVRGVIDCEAMLLPSDEVRERPAGAGRDEPNQDPYLDPNDPHLVAHRSRIANMKIIKNAKALAGGLLAGAQLLLMLKILAMAGSGIFAAIMSILMVTK